VLHGDVQDLHSDMVDMHMLNPPIEEVIEFRKRLRVKLKLKNSRSLELYSNRYV
jgi:hypothetical protein